MRNPIPMLFTMVATVSALAGASVAGPLLPAATQCADVDLGAFNLVCNTVPTEVDLPGVGTASATAAGVPKVSATLQEFSTNMSAQAEALIEYDLEITGPATSLMVPLRAVGSVYVDPEQGYPRIAPFESAYVRLGENGAYLDERACDWGLCAGAPSEATFDTDVMVPVNTPLAVTLFAITIKSLPFTGGPVATAEGFFEIDPAFLAANPDCSLVVSPGVGSPSPAPEPLSIAVFAFGLIGLRALRRR